MGTRDEIKDEIDQLSGDGQEVLRHISTYMASFEFIEAYQKWYTRAIKLVSLLGKERLEDFNSYYLPNPNRRGISVREGTYVIHDYISGADPRDMGDGRQRAIKLKFVAQLGIVKSLSTRIDSVLSDVEGHLFAELQDEELKVASHLIEINLRAAGAVSGVVLEKHLQRAAANHEITIEKKSPTIADLNEPLKKNDVYDIVTWRKIQHLADIRNYCDHNKGREPTEDEVKELISGTNSIIKTVF
jgi:hypothetical protein